MAHVSDLIAQDIDAYLQQHERKSLLRFITCGSVDDGKSTLIGRLLYESKMLFEDQLAAIEADSKKWGTQGENIDFALLVDGLAAEREQGITIDVAYRFFSTDRRKFIVADTPGHEQYTRNMVTGASTADVAILLIDARRGVLTQTRRHATLVSLLGIRHIVLAINKMDLMGNDQAVFDRIVADFGAFAQQLGMQGVTLHPIPMSALVGDNITERSARMPWYTGPALMEFLETVEIDDTRLQRGPFRLPVQWVNRPNLDFRGFAGQIAGGVVRPGDRVRVLPSGKESTVARIVTADGDLPEAVAGQSVTLTLADEIDCSRGDLLCGPDQPAAAASQFETTLVWMHEEPMRPGRRYLMKLGTATVPATVGAIRHQLNVNTLEKHPAEQLELNGIAVCTLTLDKALPFDPYVANRDTGGFILIDRLSNNTVGAGMLLQALQGPQARSTPVDAAARAAIKHQQAAVLAFVGGEAGVRASLLDQAERALHAAGRHTLRLERSALPAGLQAELPATLALLREAGLIVLIGNDTAEGLGEGLIPLQLEATAGGLSLKAAQAQPLSLPEGEDGDPALRAWLLALLG
ncbi:sulfate adenylyltransferase subunit CysN [Aquariibacter albus]|uniref:Sulfate adenylyltransferase subunit 1 n=1 Tax=Aquariibacter albus TaxID=2759899 RepID=A0A839HM14_9BURK|nr:sulfate adenylyltransferase subunit CysN [Aquariibacter albus]MBB1162392.1 sulfate adenylyltransferase subunit CysN [Aquariibacter albus]